MELGAEMAERIAQKVDLSTLLLQEVSVVKYLPRQLASLKDDITSLRAKLVDYQVSTTTTVHDNVDAQDWLQRVRSALYDTEDVVDRIYDSAKARQIEMQQNIIGTRGSCGSTSNRSSISTRVISSETLLRLSLSPLYRFVELLKYRRRAKEIKELREKLNDVAENAFQVASDLEPRNEEERTESLVSAKPLVRRNADRDAIIRMLQKQHPNPRSGQDGRFSAILVYGMAGLGKTTLAQLVFNQSWVSEPDIRVWVWVGNALDSSSLVSRISEAVTEKILQGQPNAKLEDEVQGKTLLLVLDDVRSLNAETFVRLREASLLGAASATKVVVTTRSEQVATACSEYVQTTLYEVGSLSDEEAWKLFKKAAFTEDQQQKQKENEHEDAELLDLGWEMLKRTNNVPRIIKDLATLLKGADKRKWKVMMNAHFSRLRQGYSPFTSSSDLVFCILPSPLKRCLAYSALFQQNVNIEMRRLTHLWIAQGYIEEQLSDDENQNLEEAAQDCYTALRDWSFFKDHDSDFDLAQSVAAREMLAYHFNCTQEGSVIGPVHADPNDWEGIYHLFISSSSGLSYSSSGLSNASLSPPHGTSSSKLRDWISSLPSQLRSFLMVPGSIVGLDESVCDQLFSRLTHLRSLDLNSSNITVVPASIGLLEDLRYLNLSLNDFIKLPDTITTLVKLQVLDLSSCKKLVILPTHLYYLRSLRHLYLGGCKSLTGMPVGIGKMTALQTLNLFVLGKSQRFCKLEELSSLNLKSELTYGFASQL